MNKFSIPNEISAEELRTQHHWKSSIDTFTPVIEKAFIKYPQAKQRLYNALYLLSANKTAEALNKLGEIKRFCHSDDDKSAWLLANGLCCEKSGDKENAINYYKKISVKSHYFYYPYLQVAISAHFECDYRTAKNYYEACALCVADSNDKDHQAVLCMSISNLALCLIMMHKYDNAKKAIDKLEQLFPDYHGHLGIKSILFAVVGNKKLLSECLKEISHKKPKLFNIATETAEVILKGEHSHFSKIAIDKNSIICFWDNFKIISDAYFNDNDTEALINQVQNNIFNTFSYLFREPKIELTSISRKPCIILPDYYSKSLTDGYKQLLLHCPEEIKSKWHFKIKRLL